MLIALVTVVAASYVIAKACDSFEGAADYLGRNMPPGTKGTTINAIGSSLPELLTTLAFMFFIGKEGALAAGIATTAGSAVFNSVVIPALCIWVMGRNIQIILDKRVIWRDGIFLIAAELLLIFLLGLNPLTTIAGLALIVFYACYIWYVLSHKGSAEENSDEDDDEEENGFFGKLIKFDFNGLLFNNANFTNKSAWTVLGFSVIVIAIACHFLADSTSNISEALGIPLYLSAMIIAAAATSVPDTILSVKDAKKGNVEDALSNALGSNIFDITVALGLPLLLYTLIHGATEVTNNMDMQVLRAALVGITAIVIGIFVKSMYITRKTAYVLFGLYGAWVTYLIYSVVSKVN